MHLIPRECVRGTGRRPPAQFYGDNSALHRVVSGGGEGGDEGSPASPAGDRGYATGLALSTNPVRAGGTSHAGAYGELRIAIAWGMVVYKDGTLPRYSRLTVPVSQL
jgi:hypothetical protein